MLKHNRLMVVSVYYALTFQSYWVKKICFVGWKLSWNRQHTGMEDL